MPIFLKFRLNFLSHSEYNKDCILFIDAYVGCYKRQPSCSHSKDRNDIRDIDLIIPVSKEMINSITKHVVMPTVWCIKDPPIHISKYI